MVIPAVLIALGPAFMPGYKYVLPLHCFLTIRAEPAVNGGPSAI